MPKSVFNQKQAVAQPSGTKYREKPHHLTVLRFFVALIY
jgi:hypothetical protein